MSTRLSDVLARNVAVEWFEAVAVVREVAERVRDTSSGQRIPELDQVQLSEEGVITLSGASRVDEPVRRLGQLLQACLVQCDPPVQLRLMVSQATAPDPSYTSVREFADALEYFERPDRSAVLRSLYARAQVARDAPAEVAPTLDLIAPLPRHASAPQAASAKPRSSRSWRPAAAIAAVVLLVGAGTVYSQLNPDATTGTDVSALAIKASDAVGTTLVQGISAVSETVGLGRLAPADSSGAAPAAKAATVSPAPAAVKPSRSRQTARPVAQPLRIFDLAEAPVGVPVAVPLLPEATSGVALPAADAPEEAVVHATVYSASDADVTAPVGVRPQLPKVLPEGVRNDQLSQIELLVLPDGTVGSVRLVGERRGVLEGMLLSAAKAWKFVPAKKDGQPVTYRKRVWIVRQE